MGSCAAFSLSHLPAGTQAAVCAIDAETGLRARLYAMGFVPGARFEVCCGCGGMGGKRIRMRGASLVLDDASAACVQCSLVHKAQ